MNSDVLKNGIRRRRRGRAVRFALLGATMVVGAFVAAPASAKLPLDLELPPLPLPLPTLSPSIDLPVTGAVNDLTNGLLGDQLGSVGGGHDPAPAPAPMPIVRSKPRVDSWSIERLPGLQGSASTAARTAISSTQLDPPGSYTSLVGGGLRAAAGRAAALAGPLAAPLVVGLFALAMLAIAARGPGRLAKVEEDRQGFRDRRSYRL